MWLRKEQILLKLNMVLKVRARRHLDVKPAHHSRRDHVELGPGEVDPQADAGALAESDHVLVEAGAFGGRGPAGGVEDFRVREGGGVGVHVD